MPAYRQWTLENFSGALCIDEIHLGQRTLLLATWKHRHLIVTRPENLSGRERRWLSQMFVSLPALRNLLHFVLAVYRLFDPRQSPHQARFRRAALVKTPAFLGDPDLAQALAMLTPDKFDKMIAYLHSPAGQQVRTNNHVERVNRRLRYFEKVRYKWRRRRTIVRFIVLAIDRWYRQHGQHRARPKVVHKVRSKPQAPGNDRRSKTAA